MAWSISGIYEIDRLKIYKINITVDYTNTEETVNFFFKKQYKRLWFVCRLVSQDGLSQTDTVNIKIIPYGTYNDLLDGIYYININSNIENLASSPVEYYDPDPRPAPALQVKISVITEANTWSANFEVFILYVEE